MIKILSHLLQDFTLLLHYHKLITLVALCSVRAYFEVTVPNNLLSV